MSLKKTVSHDAAVDAAGGKQVAAIESPRPIAVAEGGLRNPCGPSFMVIEGMLSRSTAFVFQLSNPTVRVIFSSRVIFWSSSFTWSSDGMCIAVDSLQGCLWSNKAHSP